MSSFEFHEMHAVQSRYFSRSRPLHALRHAFVSDNERSTFVRNGCLLLRDAVDPLVLADLAHAANVLAHNESLANDVAAYRQITNSWRFSGAIADFIFHSEIGALAAGILGAPGVRLVNDALLFKSPAHGATELHADLDFWSISPKRALTIWIPLHDVDADNGTLALVPGSSCRGTSAFEALIPSVRARKIARRVWLRSANKRLVPQVLAAGDISIHDASSLHASTHNRSASVRTALAIHVMATGVTYVTPKTASQRRHAVRHGWDLLRDGDAFGESTAPLVYHAPLRVTR